MKQKDSSLASVSEEQLPIPYSKTLGWKHFAGIYAGEHVAATEFVIGATFVTLGASAKDIFIGLLIGNLLAILSWGLITAPIAVQTRLTLYWYLHKIAGKATTNLYNWVNVLIFLVISAAMITVSSSAVRFLFDIPAQLNWYPTDYRFVLVVIGVGLVVVIVAIYGFKTLAEFSTICAPWLFAMFVAGAMVLIPVLAQNVLGQTYIESWSDFMVLSEKSVWTGINSEGEKGVGILEVIGFAWAANTLTHVGLIDMALFRYAKKASYGFLSTFGMLFGHYIAWIAAGIMGGGVAIILKTGLAQLDPGDVAYYALGMSGFIIVIIAGWTTANANLYRTGLAAQAIFFNKPRKKVTFIVGIIAVVAACFPFVFTKFLPLLTYAGLLVVPVGAIVFTEHYLFPKIGLTRYWAHYKEGNNSFPALISWIAGLLFGFSLDYLQVMSFYYLFIPAWFFTALLYTALATIFGARENYAPQEEEDRKKMQSMMDAQGESNIQDEIHTPNYKPKSNVPILDIIAWAALFVMLAFAFITMFYSENMAIYDNNKESFNTVALTCTIIYFIFSYMALRLRKKDAGKSNPSL